MAALLGLARRACVRLPFLALLVATGMLLAHSGFWWVGFCWWVGSKKKRSPTRIFLRSMFAFLCTFTQVFATHS